MDGTSAGGAGARERGTATTSASPPGQRQSDDVMEGSSRLDEKSELLAGADLAEGNAKASFTVLERETCLNLLAEHSVGRVAFTIEGDAAPTILPVNYLMTNDTIVFRSTLAGTIMRHGRGYASFQVDQFDEERREGWSVLVSGRCRWIRDPGELSRLPQGRMPQPWAAGPRDEVLKITPARVSGRRISRS
ncbi:pyridoxamine 5'-phosphate oxidase family protein [Nocardiopsis sp. EMB25]|uniref:pyridoxamine 5'-phosphate oxidase family protein n=1 Tax=Nocardiopsis TaxID=2013 RepID=UPI0004776882|nr:MULTISPECIES: pyridoxamine 5'-phosphate oxidase family protein [Nocardiopsis]MCY9783552.1 pyridoxamine 5'-phosphate oxidase family protein [Nocardiopsis sp. EMB25]